MARKRRNPPRKGSSSHSLLIEQVRENDPIDLNFTDLLHQERFRKLSMRTFWPNRYIDHGVMVHLGFDEEVTQLIHNFGWEVWKSFIIIFE
jgi:hypothetical protein